MHSVNDSLRLNAAWKEGGEGLSFFQESSAIGHDYLVHSVNDSLRLNAACKEGGEELNFFQDCSGMEKFSNAPS